MDILMITFKLTMALLLVLVAIYGSVYFGQISRVEQQFGLRLPIFVKKILGALTMLPMAFSLVVLLIVLIQVVAL